MPEQMKWMATTSNKNDNGQDKQVRVCEREGRRISRKGHTREGSAVETESRWQQRAAASNAIRLREMHRNNDTKDRTNPTSDGWDAATAVHSCLRGD